jgi:hypothetical protein
MSNLRFTMFGRSTLTGRVGAQFPASVNALSPIDIAQSNGNYTFSLNISELAGMLPPSSDTFLELTDTPDSYAGQAGKIVAVNPGESALEFIPASASGGAPATAQYLTLALDGTLSNERVLTAGTNVSFVDGGPNGTLTINATGGSGTPGGSNTQIQFNDGGAFGGDADLTWNKTTNVLAIAGQQTLTPAAGSNGTALTITHSPTGAAASTMALNSIAVSSDNAATTGVGSALRVRHLYGGVAMTGQRHAFVLQSILTAATGNAAGSKFYTGATVTMEAQANDGGTGGTPAGGIYAIDISTLQQAAATNYIDNWVARIDSFLASGASVKHRAGVAITDFQSAAQGSTTDTAILIAGYNGNIGFKTGIEFAPVGFLDTSGANPMHSSATLIKTTGADTVVAGIDFTSYTFTGNAFASPGFTVNGSGVITSGGNTVLTAATGQPLDGDLTAIAALAGAGVAERTGVDTWTLNNTTGTGNIARATSPTFVTPILGTPTSGTLTNCTLPVGGITGLGTGVATFLATPSSANLAAAVTGETGSGALVFGTSPTFTTQIETPKIIGGTAAGSGLALQSTSASGTTDFIDLLVGNNGAKRAARATTNGSLVIGGHTDAILIGGNTATEQILSNDAVVIAAQAMAQFSNDAQGPNITLAKSRSGTIGSWSPVLSTSDVLGAIDFRGGDGSIDRAGARITGVVTGSPGASNMPTSLVFSVNKGGLTLTESFRIQHTNILKLSNDMFQANGSGAVTITALAPAGVAIATVTKWLRIDDAGGVDTYIPCWQ